VLRGYLDYLEVVPGSPIRARVSGTDSDPAVQVLKVSHSDPHPDGPGFLADKQLWPVTPLRPVGEQATLAGSFGIIDHCFTAAEPAATLALWVQPTRIDDHAVIASWLTASGPLLLVIDHGRFAIKLTGGSESDGRALLAAPHDVRERVWYFVAAGFDAGAGSTLLAWAQAGRTGGPYVLTGRSADLMRPAAGSSLLLGAGPGADGPRADLDGKISAPSLIAAAPDAIALMDIMNWGAERAAGDAALLARWVFGPDGDPDRIADRSGRARHGRLVNAPSLGVTGPPEAGRAREDTARAEGRSGYATAHFHRDDLEDCGWPDTHEIAVPAGAASGIYVLRVGDRGGAADLPFVVESPDTPPVLLVVPTFTWQAYANLGRDPARYPGLSHYALHRDGSPVYVTTRLKPMPTIEPGARLEVDQVDSFAGAEADAPGGATHLLMADLYVNRWLERSGVPFGAVTDGTIHARGAAALAGCAAVVLSAHPEYWTAPMLDALESFIDGGGSVLYLGGNGLYWVTSVHPAKPHLLEVRRQAGSQTSSAEPGEARHVFDDQPGGIWSACGRPPDRLVSVGFAGFGWDTGVPYLRTEASFAPEFAWVFDGTGPAAIGTEGLNLGGAVAIEFDSHSPGLAPDGCTVLASARPDAGGFFRSYEDGIGRAPDPLVRCDMTIRQTPSGGLVFSLGSIAASGCLSVRDGQNDLARICTNVLRRTLG
jgi:N,N-dimethylformamidase